MRQLWEQPERAADMGRRAEARYWDLFTAERMADSYHALYRELAASHETRRDGKRGVKRVIPRDRTI